MKRFFKVLSVLIASVILTSCKGIGSDSGSLVTESSTPVIEREPDTSCIMLEKLHVNDLYPNGILLAQDPDFVASFTDKAAKVPIPDLRKGDSVELPEDLSSADRIHPGVVLLAQFPEDNVFVFGYYDAETFGECIILDIGDQQNLSYSPCRYGEPSKSIYPYCVLSETGKQLYLAWNTQGSNNSAGELTVFDWTDGVIRTATINNALVEQAILDSVNIGYQREKSTVKLFINGNEISESALTEMLPVGQDIVPESFDVCEYLTYSIDDNGCKAHCTPVLHSNCENEHLIYMIDAPDIEVSLKWNGSDWNVCDVSSTSSKYNNTNMSHYDELPCYTLK